MKDLVVFLQDIFFAEDHRNIVFKKGKEYEILSEDKDSIFVCSRPNTTECSQIPKIEEGHLFEYKR